MSPKRQTVARAVTAEERVAVAQGRRSPRPEAGLASAARGRPVQPPATSDALSGAQVNGLLEAQSLHRDHDSQVLGPLQGILVSAAAGSFIWAVAGYAFFLFV